MVSTKVSIHFHRIVALWAFIECSLGGLAHTFKLPFTALYVGGGSMFCIILIARYVGVAGIFQALATVLSIKFLLNPHSPIGAYLAVSFQAVLGYLLFRFSPFFYLNVIGLFCLGFLESALQKVLVLSFLYGENLYKVLDKILKNFADLLHLSFSPDTIRLFAIYVLFYGLAGLLLGTLVARYILFLEKNKWQSKVIFPDTNLDIDILKKGKSTPKVYFSLLFLLFILSFLYFSGEKPSWWSVCLSVLAIVFWFGGFLPIVLNYFLPKQSAHYQKEILNILPQIRKIWYDSYLRSRSFGFPRRIFLFLHIFVINVLFVEQELPFEQKADI